MTYKDFEYFRKNEFYYWRMRPFKKYYIIRRPEPGAGFFSNYMWVLGHLVFAERLKYIPVVDMKNYKTLYSEEIPVNGEENAWNYYFEDVGSISLDDALKSNRYIFGQLKYLAKYSDQYSSSIYRFPTREMVSYFYPIIQKHIRIKNELINQFQKEWNGLTEDKHGKVLGVHIRGTDMKNDQWNHPVPAACEQYLIETEHLLQKYGDISKVFLATDEEAVVEKFKQFFAYRNCQLIFNRAFRAPAEMDSMQKRIGIHEMQAESDKAFHKYRLGLDVLRDAWFLSKCDFLLCGHSNVANVAILWNNNMFQELRCI